MAMRAIARMVTQTVDWEIRDGDDAQGAPTYATYPSFEGRVVREDKLFSRANGTEVATTVTVYLDASVEPAPTMRDRLTAVMRGDRCTLIVEERYDGHDLKGTTRYVRLYCREE